MAEGKKNVRLQRKTGHISRKRWEIRPRLLLITNRKSHIGFRMT